MNIRSIFKLASDFLALAQEEDKLTDLHNFIKRLIITCEIVREDIDKIRENFAWGAPIEIFDILGIIKETERELNAKNTSLTLNEEIASEHSEDILKKINNIILIRLKDIEFELTKKISQNKMTKQIIKRIEKFIQEMIKILLENKKIEEIDWRPTETIPEDWYGI